jgi:hypothetical protein
MPEEGLPTSDNEYAAKMAERAGRAKETVNDAKAIGKAIASGGEDVVDDVKAGFAFLKWVPKICACSTLFYACLFGILLFFIYMFAPGETLDKANGSEVANACGQKVAVQKAPSLNPSQCQSKDGKHITAVISSNSVYHTTSFGCSRPGERDGIDNCIPSCPGLKTVQMNVNGNVQTVNLPEKKAHIYEEAFHYFSANATQYGCNSTLLVTNPKTGQAVVVKAIDTGPYCGVHPSYGPMQVNGEPMRFDYATSAGHAIGDPETVKVDKVPDTTPIGPVSSCTATGGVNNIVNDFQELLSSADLG